MAANDYREITAVFLGERLRFESRCGGGPVIVGSARIVQGEQPEGTGEIVGEIEIKGPSLNGGMRHRVAYRMAGRWTTYTNKRTRESKLQFSFDSYTTAEPHDRDAVVAYLATLGEGRGIGRARAGKLFEAFGTDAVRVCRESPEQAAAAVAGWPVADAERLSAILARHAATEAVTIDLTGLFDRRGLPKSTVRKCVEIWGTSAAEHVRRNPYRLMRFRGCGFVKTDRLYLDLKHNPTALKRQALSAWHTLARDSEGHTWFPVEQAIVGIQRSVAGADVRPVRAIQLAKRAGLLSVLRTDGGRLVESGGQVWLAETKNADQEAYIAGRLVELMRAPSAWPPVSRIMGIEEHQRDRLAVALGGPASILGGSPGTGKTYTAAALIKTIGAAHGYDCIAVAAPTGKAAVRISEVLANYGVPLTASTIHSLLKRDPTASSSDDGWAFWHCAARPLPFRYIVVDESSMPDVPIMASFLAACQPGTHILFVGDVNQLPPVGHGAPLRDMIAAGLPYGELTEIHRQAAGSSIVQACAAIRDERTWEPDAAISPDMGKNLDLASAGDPEKQKRELLASIRMAADVFKFDPVWDCQVLVPVNAKSAISRKELNAILQVELNPSPAIEGTPFRVGDKIVNTANKYFRLADGFEQGDDDGDNDDVNDCGEIYVANGDQAEVLAVEEKSLVARLTIRKRTIRIPRGKVGATSEDGDDDAKDDDGKADKAPKTGTTWDLAYAISAHKSQGSEWPVVIVMLDEYPGARKVCSREWLYTAISRAKKLCVLIGNLETARKFCRRVAIGDRKTFLRELIEREQCRAMVEEL